MTNNPAKERPKGISLLSIFYGINALLFLATTIIFFDYVDIVIFAKAAPFVIATSIRAALIIITLFLAIGLYRLRKEAFFLAVIYHIFFIANGLATILHLQNRHIKIRPLLEIVLKPEYQHTRVIDLLETPVKTYTVQALGVLIGFYIIIYLFKQKDSFKV